MNAFEESMIRDIVQSAVDQVNAKIEREDETMETPFGFGIEPAYQFNLRAGQVVRVAGKSTNLCSAFDPRVKQALDTHGYIDGIVYGYVESRQSVIINVQVANSSYSEIGVTMMGPASMLNSTLRIQDFIDGKLRLIELVPKEDSDE